MFRYRCPNAACGRVLSAPPIRAGRPSVCPGCARPLTIPADPRDWLPDASAPEPVAAAAPTVARVAAPPDLFPPSDPGFDLFAPIPADAPAGYQDPAPTPPPWAPLPEEAGGSDDDPPPLWEPSPVETPLPLAEELSASVPSAPVGLPASDADTPAPAGSLAVPSAGIGDGGRVSFDLPAPADPPDPAGLTAALSARMRPLPRRPGDLHPATALWLLLAGAGVALLGLTLLTPADLANPAVYLGAGLVEVGYLWAVWRAFRRSPARGLLCAVPPLTLWFLLRRSAGDRGPLRYVLAGAAVAGLGWVAPSLAPTTRAWVGATDAKSIAAPRAAVTPPAVADRLRESADRRADDQLLVLLGELAQADPATAADRAAVAAAVEGLARHPDPEVRAAALAADVTWGGAAAKARVLAAVGGPDRDDRLAALRLLPRWKDDDAARAAAGRVGTGGRDAAAARAVLVEIGGPVAERAVLPLLKADDQRVRLAAIDLLADPKVGGPAAAAELKAVAEESPDPGTRLAAAAAAARIAGR